MQKKRLTWKGKFNFKIDGVTNLLTKSYNAHIAQYLQSKDKQFIKFGQVIE